MNRGRCCESCSELIRVDFRCAPRGVPESDYFNTAGAKSVNDAVTLEDDLANFDQSQFWNDSTSLRKSGQCKCAVDELVAEPACDFRTGTLRDESGEGLQVAFCARCEDYFVLVHERSRFRSCSAVRLSP